LNRTRLHQRLSQWPDELKLLVHLTRRPDDVALVNALSRLPDASSFDWKSFIDLAEFHRVDSLVALNLGAHPNAPVPEFVRKRFARKLRRKSMHSLSLARASLEIASAFTKAGIKYILLKGHAVSNRYYENSVARQSIDIDILVSEQDIHQAQSLIEGLEYQRFVPTFVIPPKCEDIFRALAKDISFRRPKDGVQMELHWRLSRNPHLVNWEFDELMQQTTQTSLGSQEITVMTTPAQLIYLIFHGANHTWFRLKWLVDLHRIKENITDEQWGKVFELARRQGVMEMTATSMEILATIYESPTKEFQAKQMNEHVKWSQLSYVLKVIKKSTFDGEVRLSNLSAFFRTIAYQQGLRKEMRYKGFTLILYYLADVRDIETLRLPKNWLWLYVILGPFFRLKRLFTREIKSLWAMASGQRVGKNS